MTIDEVTVSSHGTPGGLANYSIGQTVHGAALFIDVRKSSQIVDFVERHHGPGAATSLFMNFLVGVMSTIDGPAVYESGPSGDAVLALFVGETCASDAIDAALRAIEYLSTDFLKANRHHLTCLGNCGVRECPTPSAFRVGAGVDNGAVTSARVHVGKHESVQLVGACISFASKLSGAAPPNTVAVSTGTFHQFPALAKDYRWESREMVVGNNERMVMLVDPSR
ncbi:hypothetical protein IOD16_00200 [Saccharothrix sp. 6-C]|uniref:hypothetical protein n=1 Tax=Saccharothrix sp. 6-C TaxID=2781735 RepID=UPI0019177F30|nr:hypothetical protein [Saccharothrix sp. 6-C]QQQ77030.1 hypothetical protein IOD16_00200 [Saccharothrix sp. 6-C]